MYPHILIKHNFQAGDIAPENYNTSTKVTHSTAISIDLILVGIDKKHHKILKNTKREIDLMYTRFITKMDEGFIKQFSKDGKSIDVIIGSLLDTFSEGIDEHIEKVPEKYRYVFDGLVKIRKQDFKDYFFSLYNSIYGIKDIKNYN